MEEAIEQGGDGGIVHEDLASVLKACIRGKDHGASFVARVDELEQQVGAALSDWQIAHLIDEEVGVLGQEADPLGAADLRVRPRPERR